MLTNIPKAKLYVLLPVGEPSTVINIGDTRICGGKGSTLTFSQLLMDEIARVIDDGDIVGTTGINLERCMIIVNFSKEHCLGILNGGLIAVDKLFKKFPHLIPNGGSFMVRDWEDIPDSEKAGKKKG